MLEALRDKWSAHANDIYIKGKRAEGKDREVEFLAAKRAVPQQLELLVSTPYSKNSRLKTLVRRLTFVACTLSRALRGVRNPCQFHVRHNTIAHIRGSSVP